MQSIFTPLKLKYINPEQFYTCSLPKNLLLKENQLFSTLYFCAFNA